MAVERSPDDAHAPAAARRRKPARHAHHAPISRVVEALTILVDTGGVTDIEQMIHVAERLQEPGVPDVANFIRTKVAQEQGLFYAIEQVRAFVQSVALTDRASLLREIRDLRVGILHPVPPHLVEMVDAAVEQPLTVFMFDDHHIPPHLEDLDAVLIVGFRQIQRRLRELDAVVLEADLQKDGTLAVHDEVADLLGAGSLAPELLVVVHQRPHHHRHPPHPPHHKHHHHHHPHERDAWQTITVPLTSIRYL